MNKFVKIIVEILLALAAVGCVYGIYRSIMKPVNFNKEKARRQEVAVQRLKDIRTLEVAFKGVTTVTRRTSTPSSTSTTPARWTSSCRSVPTTTPSPS